ncbi:MAG: hypothetical protein RLZZ15_1973 [Verrucomicrobiota bacterium]
MVAGAPGVWGQGDAMKKPASPAVVTFVAVDTAQLVQVLPAPPAAGSIAAAADLEAVVQAQGWRTAAQVEWARAVDKNDVFVLFGAEGLLGANFTAEKFPRLIALLKAATDDTRPPIDAAKQLHARARPFKIDGRVQPCIDLPAGDSYPSGHGFGAHFRAAILAEIFPGKRAQLEERAHRIAWGRVLAGVHFPSDVEAGRRLAEASVAELQKSAAFRAALEACRAEAAAAELKKAG